jgi:hypothetical protein
VTPLPETPVKRPTLAALLVVSLSVALNVAPTPAQQQPRPPGGALGQNAALRYWQAFAAFPKLDERQQKLLAEPPARDEAAKLAAAGENALLYLHRGAAIAQCDWGLHREDGPYLLLPHLAKGRDLARLASLRARLDFAAGNGARAVDTAADALVMGRHLSTDLTAIVSYLVQLAVERVAIEALASNLAGLDAAALDRLDARLAALPPGGSLEACMGVERDSFLDWALTHLRQMTDEDPWKEKVLTPMSSPESANDLEAIIAAAGGTREGMIRQFEGLRPYYQELGAILRLPRDQFRTKFADVQRRVEGNAVAKAVLPSMEKVYDRDAAGRTRMTLLKAAVAVVRGGPDRAKEFKDAGGATLEYAATADGFELRSKVVDDGKPVALKVGGRNPK